MARLKALKVEETRDSLMRQTPRPKNSLRFSHKKVASSKFPATFLNVRQTQTKNKNMTANTTELNTVNAELSEIAALEKQIADRKAAANAKAAELRKETRVGYLNKTINNAKEEIAEFVGVPYSDWATATKEQKAEIADFIDSLVEALDSDSPATGGGKRGPRLDDEALKARNEAIANEFRQNSAITAKEVAAKYEVSEATVNIVKKNMGLVTPRKAKDYVTVTPVPLPGVSTPATPESAS